MQLILYVLFLTDLRLFQCALNDTIDHRRNIPMHQTVRKRKLPLKLSSMYTTSPSTKTYYNPNPGYDAYWTDGHWIFGTTTTKARDTSSTRSRLLVCRKPCAIEYRYVAEVCGHRVDHVNEWHWAVNVDHDRRPQLDAGLVHFRTFTSYCEFLAAQCKEKVWNNMGWVFIHFGKCVSDTEVLLPFKADRQVVDRKKWYLSLYNRTIKQDTDPMYNDHCQVWNWEKQTHQWVDRVNIVGSCYLLRLEKTYSFHEARRICKDYGADLVVLDNEVERDVVMELLNEVNPSYTFYTDFTKMMRSYFVKNPAVIPIPLYLEYMDSISWLFVTSRDETLHEIGYQPWTKDRGDVDIREGVYTCIILKASDCAYDSRELDLADWQWRKKAYPLCEKRISPRVMF